MSFMFLIRTLSLFFFFIFFFLFFLQWHSWKMNIQYWEIKQTSDTLHKKQSNYSNSIFVQNDYL